jgi:hypothetical protein
MVEFVLDRDPEPRAVVRFSPDPHGLNRHLTPSITTANRLTENPVRPMGRYAPSFDWGKDCPGADELAFMLSYTLFEDERQAHLHRNEIKTRLLLDLPDYGGSFSDIKVVEAAKQSNTRGPGWEMTSRSYG